MKIRLQARNITQFQGNVTGTRMTRLAFDGNENNQIAISELYYYFPVGTKLTFAVAGIKTDYNDFIRTLSPFEPSGSGSLSAFGRFSPIYRPLAGAGLSVYYAWDKHILLNAAYLSNNAFDPSNKNGLFNGSYGALGQVIFSPTRHLDLGLTYVHAYNDGGGINGVNLTGGTGSALAARPFGNVATSQDSVGLESFWQITHQFGFSGWFSYSFARSEVNSNNAQILNYAVGLSFPDLGGKGNLGGIIFGTPPKVVDSSLQKDRDTSFHIEGLYRWQINDNIAITPGLIIITDPEHNRNNDNIFVGVLRTTFRF